MEHPQETPKMPPKKKTDFMTEQFLRSVKHWTDSFVSGEVKVGIFLNSIQDDAHSFCRHKQRMGEWEDFLKDFISSDEEMSQESQSSSGEVIDVDDDFPN